MPQVFSGLDNGYGAPFVTVYYKDKELTTNVQEFSYMYDEEGDDVCKMELLFDDRSEADQPQWQEKAELKILWGFIQGELSPSRKIYIQQLEWNFDKSSNVVLKIEATDKANSMKYEDSQEVHQHVDLPSLAAKFGEDQQINAFLEIPDNSDEQPLEFYLPKADGSEDFNNYLKKNRDAIAKRDLKKVQDFAKDNPEQNDSILKRIQLDSNYIKALQSGDPRKLGKYQLLHKFKFNIYDNAPQANKTQMQMLKEYGKREPNGPYLIDSRDDGITIRKRNFKQAPYKSYTWGGDEGSLLEFAPMSKNRSHKASSMNMGFSAWDPMSKNSFSGNANPLDDTDETLSKFRKMYKFYKDAENAGHGADIVGNVAPRIIHQNLGNNNFKGKIDKSADYTKTDLFVPYTVSDRVKALRDAVESVLYQQRLANNNYSPLATNPVDAYGMAANDRRDAELKNNPATASFYGDPNLIVGKLITIMGISKKYSGNYYIMKAVHRISKNGYFVALDMCTQGYNIKASTDDNKGVGKMNRMIGDSSYREKRKKVKVKSNPK